MGFDKIYGAKERQDGLYKIGREKYEVVFGYGCDDRENGYNYRKQYKGRKPDVEELKAEIMALVNADVDAKIQQGYTYEGHLVWLSRENQLNYVMTYIQAVESKGANLPVKFKLGTDDKPVFKEFTTLEELQQFCFSVALYVQKVLAEGWEEKYSIDWSKFECEE